MRAAHIALLWCGFTASLVSSLASSGCAFDPENPLAVGAVPAPVLDASAPIDPSDAGSDGGVRDDAASAADTGTSTQADAGELDGDLPDVPPGLDVVPGPDVVPDLDALPASDVLPATDALPGADRPTPAPDGGIAPDSGVAPFPYAPSNLTPADVLAGAGATAVIDVPIGGNCTIDSSGPTIAGDCGASAPAAPTVVQMPGGGEAALVALSRLRVQTNGIIRDTTLRLIGTRPVIFLVRGDIDIEGGLDASADMEVRGPGAGSNAQCGAANGVIGADDDDAGGGGGGGARGTAGGRGGNGASSATRPGGAGGAPFEDRTLSPLFGGCPGVRGGNVPDNEDDGGDGGVGGGGGGAVQLSSGQRLRVSGRIHAGGGGGRGGAARAGGGGGGGSGGAVLLEGASILLETFARVTLNGGGGGEAGSGARPQDQGGNGRDGENGEDSARQAANGGANGTTTGGNGGDGAVDADAAGDANPGAPPGGSGSPNLRGGGGGGGGGGLGRLRLRAPMCTLNTTEVSAVVRRDCP